MSTQNLSSRCKNWFMNSKWSQSPLSGWQFGSLPRYQCTRSVKKTTYHQNTLHISCMHSFITSTTRPQNVFVHTELWCQYYRHPLIHGHLRGCSDDKTDNYTPTNRSICVHKNSLSYKERIKAFIFGLLQKSQVCIFIEFINFSSTCWPGSKWSSDLFFTGLFTITISMTANGKCPWSLNQHSFKPNQRDPGEMTLMIKERQTCG